jgi:hypothetical protein
MLLYPSVLCWEITKQNQIITVYEGFKDLFLNYLSAFPNYWTNFSNSNVLSKFMFCAAG